MKNPLLLWNALSLKNCKVILNQVICQQDPLNQLVCLASKDRMFISYQIVSLCFYLFPPNNTDRSTSDCEINPKAT